MKRYIFFSIVTIILSAYLISCEDFLKEKPKTFLSPDGVFKTKNDIFAGVVSVYDGLGSNSLNYYKRRFLYLNWFCSDEINSINLAEKNLDNFTFNSTDANISDTWATIYDQINRANTVLTNIPKVPMTKADANQYEAEVRFLRALGYFNLSRVFGDIPIHETETASLEDAFKERSPLADVYKLVISDLTFAKDNMAPTNEKGRATSGAAKALLARVYLTKATSSAAAATDYQSCATLCTEVIGSGTYRLMPDFEKAIGKEDAYNAESIFEFESQRVKFPNELTAMGAFFLPAETFATVRFPQLKANFPDQAASPGGSNLFSEIPFFNRFDKRDYRKEKTFVSWGIRKSTGDTIQYTSFITPFPSPSFKFIDESQPTSRSGYAFETNIIILRLADVYLMKAEALNEIGGPTPDAYAALNAIRTRARNRDGKSSNGYPADLAGLTKETFRDAVMDERMIELAFEGHRWFDLVRTSRLVSLFATLHPEYGITTKHMLFPIPKAQLDLKGSKLKQNPGWD